MAYINLLFGNLRQLRVAFRSLISNAALTFTLHSFLVSRLNDCNALYVNLPLGCQESVTDHMWCVLHDLRFPIGSLTGYICLSLIPACILQ